MSEKKEVKLVCEQHESDEVISCYLPELNKHFTANTMEEAEKIASNLYEAKK